MNESGPSQFYVSPVCHDSVGLKGQVVQLCFILGYIQESRESQEQCYHVKAASAVVNIFCNTVLFA